jgi:hypothetical protein
MPSELKPMTETDLEAQFEEWGISSGVVTDFRLGIPLPISGAELYPRETNIAWQAFRYAYNLATCASDWQAITPENLPKVGDEIGKWWKEFATGPTFWNVRAAAQFIHGMTAQNWIQLGWTHFRPINPPEPSGVQGQENAS